MRGPWVDEAHQISPRQNSRHPDPMLRAILVGVAAGGAAGGNSTVSGVYLS